MAKKKQDGVSDEAVLKATGKTWPQWFDLLNKAGAKTWSHKEIVAYLKEHAKLSAWWEQTVTVAYEKAHNKRVLGQTNDAGFQLGIQKTLPIDRASAWKLLCSTKGVALWLGKIKAMKWEEGFTYATAAETHGELRVIKPQERLRLTWQPKEMKKPATLQVTLTPSGPDKTALRFHLEKLPSADWRTQMKKHWDGVLQDLLALTPNG